MSIRLHKELGVNPRLIETQCRVCGETSSDSLVLLGAANVVDTCPACHANVYGGVSAQGKCPRCGEQRPDGVGWNRRQLEEHEKITQAGICDTCKDYMKQGIVLISTEDSPTDIQNPYRTGGFVVVKEEAMRRMINDPELLESICKARVAYICDSDWKTMGLPANHLDKATPGSSERTKPKSKNNGR